MGMLIEGAWRPDRDLDVFDADGGFVRPSSEIHGRLDHGVISRGRYHLYVMPGCPWAHRTWLMWTLRQLGDTVSLSLLAARMDANGWEFAAERPDPIGGYQYLHQVYAAGAPGYTGRCTVPVLWDKLEARIASNDSAEIMRYLGNGEFYPAELRDEIDAVEALMQDGLNNGVYRAGFARTQAAHDRAVDDVFATLDALEQRLSTRRYLCGDQLTEADWRAFPTLIRFDVAYNSAFGCSLRRIMDYPNLWRYSRDLYSHPGVSDTVDLELYHRGYHSIPIAVGHRRIMPRMPAIPL